MNANRVSNPLLQKTAPEKIVFGRGIDGHLLEITSFICHIFTTNLQFYKNKQKNSQIKNNQLVHRKLKVESISHGLLGLLSTQSVKWSTKIVPMLSN